jgi:hypothetical protein
MVAGFLGAGKTTAILQLGPRLADQRWRFGLLSNDQGRRLLDSALFAAGNFPMQEIPSCCFCCRFNSLVEASRRLTAENQPDVFVAEPAASCTVLSGDRVRLNSAKKLWGSRDRSGAWSQLLVVLLALSWGGRLAQAQGPGVEKHPLTYLGFHADPFWEDPPRPDHPGVGAQYAYLGQGGAFIGVLNDKDNWKREDVGREMQVGETYATRFKAPYAGEWKLVARLAGELAQPAEASNLVKDPGGEGHERVRFRGCDFPLGWGCYEGAGTAEWGVTVDAARNGKKSVFMKITGHDERPVANTALTLGATAGYSGADAFAAQPSTTYQFSFWLKGKGFRGDLSVYGQGWKEPVNQAASRQQLLSTLSAVRPTDEWRRYEGTFRTAADTKKVALFIGAYGNKDTAPPGTVRIWDAKKKYTMKRYDMRAWQDRTNWSQVPCDARN